MISKIYLPMFCARLEHVDDEGRTLKEEVYRVPLVFRDIDHAKANFEKAVAEMENVRLVEIVQAGWFVPETGRVLACEQKKRSVENEKKSVVPSCE